MSWGRGGVPDTRSLNRLWEKDVFSSDECATGWSIPTSGPADTLSVC